MLGSTDSTDAPLSAGFASPSPSYPSGSGGGMLVLYLRRRELRREGASAGDKAPMHDALVKQGSLQFGSSPTQYDDDGEGEGESGDRRSVQVRERSNSAPKSRTGSSPSSASGRSVSRSRTTR